MPLALQGTGGGGTLVFMTDASDQNINLAQILLRDTAKRLKRALPAGEIALAGFGPRPRIGQIFDRLQSEALQNNAEAVPVGPYLFDSADLTLRDEGRVLRLTEKERDILLALLGASGQRIERREMLEKVWGYASGVETHTLETHVYRLRQKMEIDPARPVIVLTDGDGYRLA